MKVILLKDVKGIGRAHEEVVAKDGHALNFLIPKKLAVAATVGARKEAEVRKTDLRARSEVSAKLIEQNLATLAEGRLLITAKANEKGHLYDAVGESEILAAAKEQVQVELPEGAIKLPKPIKEIGDFEIPVAVGEMFGKFSITVQPEMESK